MPKKKRFKSLRGQQGDLPIASSPLVLLFLPVLFAIGLIGAYQGIRDSIRKWIRGDRQTSNRAQPRT